MKYGVFLFLILPVVYARAMLPVSSAFYTFGESPLPPSTCQSALLAEIYARHYEAGLTNTRAVFARSYPFFEDPPLALRRVGPLLGSSFSIATSFPQTPGQPPLSPVESVTLGLQQQFFAEFVRVYVTSVLNEMSLLSQAVVKEVTQNTLKEAKAPLTGSQTQALQDEEGIYQLPFLQSRKSFILTHILPPFPRFRDLGPQKQKTKTAEVYKQWLSRDLKTYTQAFLAQARKEAFQFAHKDLKKWQAQPQFGMPTHGLEALMREQFELFLSGLTERVGEIETLDQFLQRHPHIFTPPSKSLIDTSQGNLSFQIPTKQIQGRFDTDLGAILIGSAKGYYPNAHGVTLALHHGAGFLSSTVASWADPIPRLTEWGFNPNALDLPWSLGPHLGISMHQIASPIEVANYCQGWHAAMAADHFYNNPVVTLDRSFGSTATFATALINHVRRDGRPSQESASAYVMTSFSNPLTIEDQTSNIDLQLQAGNRDALQGVVPEVIDYVKAFDRDLLQMMDGLLEENPQALNHFGHNMIFVNGQADADGAPLPTSPYTDVADALIQFRDKYAPLAPVYILPDPLQAYPQAEASLDLDLREAAHYLLNNRPNMTAEEAKQAGLIEAGVPEQAWPKFADQRAEVMALTYAFLDYLIETSQWTDPLLRAKLKKSRLAFTGSPQSHGYFKWFISKLNEQSKDPQAQLDFDTIASPQTPAGRKNLLERMKTILLFFEQEAQRTATLR